MENENMNPQNSFTPGNSPVQPSAPEPQNEPQAPRGGSAGPMIASIIVIVLLVLAGLYFLNKIGGNNSNEAMEAELSNEENVLQDEELSESDDIDSIEADLGATTIVESDLSGVEEEIE